MSGDDARWNQQRTALVKYVQQKLLVRHLQTILKQLALPVSGLKVAQQARLVDHIDETVRKRNEEGFRDLRRLIYHTDSLSAPNTPSPAVVPNVVPAPRPPPLTFSTPHYSSPGMYQTPIISPLTPVMGSVSQPADSLTFFPSPFYEPQSTLCQVQNLPSFGNSNQQRHIVTIPITLSHASAEDIRLRGMRAILYCAHTDAGIVAPYHVTFPQQIEIRVNNKAISANLRGLKNRPGTTRPLDITEHIEKTSGYRNTISITYALSPKRYLCNVKLVRKHTPDQLAARIKGRAHISKQSVLDRLRKESEDEDIVATSTVLSLKCPLSTLRIDTPIRSVNCKHQQCYDAISFLQLQEQAPTWNCPVCNKKIEFEHLAVDNYVSEILGIVKKDVESVTIDPKGEWTLPDRKSPSPRVKNDNYSDDDDEDDDDDDDEISILPPDRLPTMWRTTNGTPQTNSIASTPTINNVINFPRPTLTNTPKSLSSEPQLLNSASRPNGGSSNKRPAPVTIDLTLSDDDDDEIRPPPPKRHQTSATPTPINRQSAPSTLNAGPFTISWPNAGFGY